MNKHFTFDDMINTMMPLPISGNANGEGIYCRGQELVASMDQPKETAHQEKKTADSTSAASSASIASINKKLVVSG